MMNENRKDVSSSSGSTPTTSIQQGVQGGSQDVQQDLSTVDKLLASYTHHVSSPPDEMCSICLDSLQLPSDFDEDMKLKKDSQNKSQSQNRELVTLSGRELHMLWNGNKKTRDYADVYNTLRK
nr:uncharacterized protein LOC128692244 isoform X2 [Cherax quadricarinatus]